MSHANPTKIRIGMTGKFFGRIYHVIGRAVLGVREADRVYYWNEYYLKSDGVEIVTLVYEQNFFGGEWRWFTMFDPTFPLAASDVAIKRAGDYVTVDDTTAEITLVRQSRVHHVEGDTPEGVVLGAHANYFNAKDGTKLFVVSWTGDEVEFYRGMNLTPGTVASGFNLSRRDVMKFGFTSGGNVTLMLLAAAIVIFIGLVFFAGGDWGGRPSGVTIFKLSAPPLKRGASGNLFGTSYRIEGHAEVEIAEVGRRLLRHEYFLRDENGNEALLVFGWNSGEKTWLLFTPLHPAMPLTPQTAARIRLGETVAVENVTAKVNELFRSTILQSEDTTNSNLSGGEVRYGFAGRAGTEYLLARWNEQGIAFDEGEILSDREVTTAFTK
jgi:hypothetical protein